MRLCVRIGSADRQRRAIVQRRVHAREHCACSMRSRRSSASSSRRRSRILEEVAEPSGAAASVVGAGSRAASRSVGSSAAQWCLFEVLPTRSSSSRFAAAAVLLSVAREWDRCFFAFEERVDESGLSIGSGEEHWPPVPRGGLHSARLVGEFHSSDPEAIGSAAA